MKPRCEVNGCGTVAGDVAEVSRVKALMVCAEHRFDFHQALLAGNVRSWFESVTA